MARRTAANRTSHRNVEKRLIAALVILQIAKHFIKCGWAFQAPICAVFHHRHSLSTLDFSTNLLVD